MKCNGGVYNISRDGIGDELPGDSERITTAVVLPLIALIGVVSNGSFLFVVARLKRMRTPTNRYLVGLALADAADVCSGVGHKLWLYHSSPLANDQSGYGGSGACTLAIFVITFAYASTLALITLVSLEKYRAVCHPLRWAREARGPGGRRAGKAAALGLLSAALLSLTSLPSCGAETVECLRWPPGVSLPSVRVFYRPATARLEAFESLMRVVPFLATSAVCSACYGLILRALGRRVAAMESHGAAANADAGLAAKNRAARMLVISGTTHLLLLAPLELTLLCFAIGRLRGGVYLLDEHRANILFQVARLLSYINSAINPLIYVAVNRKYREAYQTAFWCKTVPNR